MKILHGVLLRLASLLIRSPERAEWFAEWNAEAPARVTVERCGVAERGLLPGRFPGCVLAAAPRVAACAANQSLWLASPSRCLLLLAGVDGLSRSATLPFPRRAGPIPFRAILLIVGLAGLILFATTSLKLGDYTGLIAMLIPADQDAPLAFPSRENRIDPDRFLRGPAAGGRIGRANAVGGGPFRCPAVRFGPGVPLGPPRSAAALPRVPATAHQPGAGRAARQLVPGVELYRANLPARTWHAVHPGEPTSWFGGQRWLYLDASWRL